jgi:hypothetical protein
MRSSLFDSSRIDDEQDFLLFERLAEQDDTFLDRVVDESCVFGLVLSARCRSSSRRPVLKEQFDTPVDRIAGVARTKGAS